MPALAALADDRDLVGDLVAVLEREDYAEWEREEGVRARLRASVWRVMAGVLGDSDALGPTVDVLLRQLAGSRDA